MEDHANSVMHQVILSPSVLVLALLAYSYFLVTKIPSRKLRVIFLLPTIYFFCILPWFFPSAFLRYMISYFITWMSSSKLLLFCFDQGPLIACKNFIDFVSISIFPFKMRKTTLPHPNLETLLNLELLGHLAFLSYSLTTEISYTTGFIISVHVTTIFLTWFSLVRSEARYEFVQFFNKPYLAKSLREFWGKMHNLYSSYMLRLTVYEPTWKTLSGRFIPVSPAKIVGTIATFAVSAIMHELMFYYITCGKEPKWEVACFWVLQGFGILVEVALESNNSVWIQRLGPIVWTIGFLSVPFHYLMFMPVWRHGKNDCQLRPRWFTT